MRGKLDNVLIAIIMNYYTAHIMEDLSFSGSGLREENFTVLTCAAKSLQTPSNSSSLDSAIVKVIYVLLFSAIIVSGLILNSLVVILVIVSKKLKTKSFGIAVQIALTNMAIVLLVGLPAQIQIIYGQPITGLDLCIASGYITYMFVETRIWLIFLFSLDRFASVFAPFLYPRLNFKSSVLKFSVLAWLVPIITNVPGIPQILDCYTFTKSLVFCHRSIECSSACKIFVLINIMLILVPAQTSSLVFIIALYVKGKKIRKSESAMMGIPKSHMSDSDWKALKTFLLLMITIAVAQIGMMVIVTLEGIGTPSELIYTNFFFLYLITDPLVIMRNEDARQAWKQLFKSLACLLTSFRRVECIEVAT